MVLERHKNNQDANMPKAMTIIVRVYRSFGARSRWVVVSADRGTEE